MNELSCPGRPEMAMLLLRTAERVERALDRALEGIGLSPAKLAVLGGLASAGGRLSLGDLAQRRCCVKSNITKLVDRLEADGLVARLDDPADRRGVLAEITAEGRRLQAEGERLIEEVEAMLTRDLPPAELAAARRVLGEIGTRTSVLGEAGTRPGVAAARTGVVGEPAMRIG